MAAVHTLVLLVLLALGPAPAGAATSSARTPHVHAQLLADHQAVRAGDTLWVGLRLELIPHWHVYWRNPGDSGSAPSLHWRLPAGWTAGEIHWPVPRRIPVGPLVNYGYEDAVTLLVPIRVGPVAADQTLQLEADAQWLVCQEECIPEEATLGLSVAGTAGPSRGNGEVARHFDRVRADWPRALEGQVRYRVVDGRILFSLEGLPWPTHAIETVWLAAHEWGPVAASGAQTWTRARNGLRLEVPVGDMPPDGDDPLPALLVVAERADDGPLVRGFTLEAQSAGLAGSAAGEGPGLALAAALGLALLGGLILNLMPCVLPVLAIKVMGFLHQVQGARRRLALHGASFGAGVITTLLLLAGVLIALRAGGQSLGWGFQLQSPLVVTVLAYLMLGVGLNLSGVFSVGHRLMGLGQGVPVGGARGAFWTGALAVVVASPCTAPFMGAALGYALTRPPGEALAVFLCLGVGLALPVVLLSLWPAWVRLVPKPGAWMGRLQQLLAFPMYGAAAWLVWVLSQQTGPTGFAAALAGGVVVALGAWLLGQGGRGRRVAAMIAFAGALGLATLVGRDSALATASTGTVEPWSPERVAALRTAGRPVLVNFTAAWCITCKVNERVALDRPTVARALAQREVVYLKADWTRRDARITRELARHGRSGVPLYLLFAPGATTPEVLPPLLTEGMLLAALERL